MDTYEKILEDFYDQMQWYASYGEECLPLSYNIVNNALSIVGVNIQDFPEYKEFLSIFSTISKIHVVLDYMDIHGEWGEGLHDIIVKVRTLAFKELQGKVEDRDKVILNLILINNEYKRQILQ